MSPQPAAAARLLTAAIAQAGAAELSAIACLDVALAAELIRAAGTTPSPPASLEQAAGALGPERIVQLALGMIRAAATAGSPARGALDAPAMPGDPLVTPQASGTAASPAGLDMPAFNKHCLATSLAAGMLAQRCGLPAEQAATCGLLHDLGKPALAASLPRSYARAIAAAASDGNIAHVERQLFGIDHTLAGRRLARHWALPEALSDVIWLHHQPVGALLALPNGRLAAVVQLADLLARGLRLGFSGNHQFARPEQLAEALGIPAGAVAEVAAALPAQVDKALAALTDQNQVELAKAVARAAATLADRNIQLRQQVRRLEADAGAMDAERARAERLAEQLAQANLQLAEAQDAVVKAQSMAAVAEMAAGAAHEMNNPLAVISGRAQLLASSASDPKAQGAAELIARKAQDISDIASQLLAFARPPTPQPRPVEVASLLQAAREHYLAQAAQAQPKSPLPAVDMDVEPGCPPVFVDRGQMEGVLVELVRNAAAAGGEGVHIRLQAAPSEAGVQLRVKDDGPGMDEETLAEAFTPFFSRRPAGRGRGMGLALASRTVLANGGRIWIESRPGQGATVYLDLPTRTGPA